MASTPRGVAPLLTSGPDSNVIRVIGIQPSARRGQLRQLDRNPPEEVLAEAVGPQSPDRLNDAVGRERGIERTGAGNQVGQVGDEVLRQGDHRLRVIPWPEKPQSDALQARHGLPTGPPKVVLPLTVERRGDLQAGALASSRQLALTPSKLSGCFKEPVPKSVPNTQPIFRFVAFDEQIERLRLGL